MKKIVGILVVVGSMCSAWGAYVDTPRAEHARTLRRHTGIPSIAVSPKNNRLWVTFYGGITPGEDSNNYVVLATSADGGCSWQDVLVADPDGAGVKRTFDPELFVGTDGKLRWTFTERVCKLSPSVDKYTKPYAGDFGDRKTDRLMCVTLDAEFLPVSPFPQPREISRGVMMSKPIVLRDGTSLLPVAHWYEAPSACFLATKDHGQTFTTRGGVTITEKARLFDEHVVAQLSNGDLLTFIRACWKYPYYESVSHDGGMTWDAAVPARFAQTSSRIFLKRLASGALLLVKNGEFSRDEGRSHLRAYVSRDDGKTWCGGLMLDERGGVSYPDGDQTKDGTIYVVYDHDRLGAQEILLATFTEEDAFAGKIVDRKRARLRRLVVRKDMPQAQGNPQLGTGPKYVTPWKGKKVAFLGDSITDVHHVGCRKNYWNFLEEYLGIEKYVYGINGQRWSNMPAQIAKMKTELGDNVDAIFIMMGTNDYMGGVPLGKWWNETDTTYSLGGVTQRGIQRTPNEDAKTVRGLINRAMKQLKHDFPNQQIILLTPIHRAWATFGGTNIQPDESYPNACGLYIHDYVAAVKEAGPIWSVPVIDLFAETGLFPLDYAYESYYNRADTDLIHPSTRGHDRMARTLAARIVALPPDFK